MKVGEFNALVVRRNSEFGVYLESGDEEVLLPNKYVPPGVQLGETLDVFVYHDSEDRLVATTEEPFAQVGDVVPLKVVDLGEHGAFLDWGLDKDLFLPHREKAGEVRIGDEVVVLVRVDERSGRVVATARLEAYLSRTPSGFEPGQKVRALIATLTPMGYAVALDSESLGFIYEDQAGAALRVGDAVDGWVQRVRPDGRVDVTLRPPAQLARKDDAAVIYERLQRAGGWLDLHDGSAPEDIEREFAMSKKAFKRALATLYRERKIVIQSDGIKLSDAPRKR